MNSGKSVVAISSVFGAVTLALTANPAVGQSLSRYRCADGAEFAVAFYERDPRAFVQVDGQSLILRKWPSLTGRRYSGSGVVLRFTSAGTLIKRGRLPVSTCAAM